MSTVQSCRELWEWVLEACSPRLLRVPVLLPWGQSCAKLALMALHGNEYVDWSKCLQGRSPCLVFNPGPSVRSCHSCNMCNGLWRKGRAPCSGVHVQLPSLLSSFRVGLATQSKLRVTVQARGWGEHWIILHAWGFCHRNCERNQRHSKLAKNHEVLPPSRKSCKHLNEKESWTTQVCCNSPLCQGSLDNFWASESFPQSTLSLPETSGGN